MGQGWVAHAKALQEVMESLEIKGVFSAEEEVRFAATVR
jgi:hypothetical protein